MIEIKKPDPPSPRYVDPDEPLAGKCMTCGSLVTCLQRDTAPPMKQPMLGVWSDLYSAECPKCGARVFVMPAKEMGRVLGRL